MPQVSGPITPFGQADDFATGDGNYNALGLHVKNNIAGMLAITAKRRKGVYTAAGANANPEPVACLVKDKGDGKSALYYLKTEPGTEFTLLSHWEMYQPVSIAGGIEYKGQFTPVSSTLADGIGTNGHFYIADTDGSFNGDAYVSGDWSIYDGLVWRRLPVGISALPPAAHIHTISEVTGLTDALSNKVSTSDVATSVTANNKVPTNQAVLDYTYSKSEIDNSVSQAKAEAIDEVIDDTTVSTTKAYSSDLVETKIATIVANQGGYSDANAIAAAKTNIGTGATNFAAGDHKTNADDIDSGTLNDARLSTNVVFKDEDNEVTKSFFHVNAPGSSLSEYDTGGYYSNENFTRWAIKRDGGFVWARSDVDAVEAKINSANNLEVTNKLNAVQGLQENGVDLSAKYALKTLQLDSDITSNYTIQASDNGKLRVINSASSVTITLPTGLAGIQVVLKQKGLGSFILAAGSGATIEQFEDKLQSAGQKAVVSIFAESSTVWVPNGQLIAV